LSNRIEKINDVFRLSFKYDPVLVAAVKALPGRKYDPATRKWTVPAGPHVVDDILDFATMYGFEVDDGIADMRVDQTVKSRLPDGFKIITKQDPPAWDHQKRMVAYAQELPAALWHCGMGTGKTRAAIDFIQTSGFSVVLVLCPLAVIPTWGKQTKDFAVKDMNPVALGKNFSSIAKKLEAAQFNIDISQHRREICVLIINYESAWRDPFRSWALKQEWPLLILDEGHNIKAPAGKASRFCALLGKKAGKRLALTGTPLPHSPLDAYGLCRALDPTIFGASFHRFKMRYAVMGGFQNKQVVTYQRLDEFQQRLDRIRIHVSRDVLDLPEAVHTDIPCSLSAASAKIYESLENEFYAMVDSGEITTDNALTRLLRLQQVTSGHIKTDEGEIKELSSSKAEALETLFQGISNDEPVVVFCRFTHDIETVARVAAKTGRQCLELSGKKKELESWQEGKAPVLAAQIKTAREGVDMTRARYCVYYSLGFSLSDYEQSLARTHRPGQTRTVFYYHLVTTGTVDVRVYAALKSRKNVIETILGGRNGH